MTDKDIQKKGLTENQPDTINILTDEEGMRIVENGEMEIFAAEGENTPDTVKFHTSDGKSAYVQVQRKPASFMEERQRQIIETLAREFRISTAQIQEHFGVGYETARRDLEQLEKAGLCKRTHGGAIAVEQVNVRPPYDRDFSKMTVTPDYLEIARRAASEIKKNDSIYLTSGSLGHLMLRFLPTDFFYTVVVNSADMAKELRAFSNLDVYVAGGKMRQSGSIVDSMACEFVSRMHFDLCFITGGGLTADFGFTNGTDETAAFQRTVIKNSRRKILLMPSRKIGHISFIKVCEAGEFDSVITDWDAPAEELGKLREQGLDVTVVEERK